MRFITAIHLQPFPGRSTIETFRILFCLLGSLRGFSKKKKDFDAYCLVGVCLGYLQRELSLFSTTGRDYGQVD